MQRGIARREDVLDYITEYNRTNGYAPSVGEIAQELNTVKSNIYHHLRILEREGRVTHSARVARSWRPI